MQGDKPQNRPLSNLNNRIFVQCAMLPVNNCCNPCSDIKPK